MSHGFKPEIRANFSGSHTFSLTASPCPPECNFQSETKIEPDLRLPGFLPFSLVSLTELCSFGVV